VSCSLQPAIAGVNPAVRAIIVRSGLYILMMMNGSRAVGSLEPCQAGNRAALRGNLEVP